jgi:hypothetical protein
MIEPLLLTAARILTFEQQRPLTNASGFFFERDKRLFLVTSRHVVIDEPSKHFPDRLEIELHIDPDNLARSTGFSIPLYRDGKSIWRQGLDAAGEIDVAVIEIQRCALPDTTVYRAFTPDHLHRPVSTMPYTTCRLYAKPSLHLHSDYVFRARATFSPMRALIGARVVRRSWCAFLKESRSWATYHGCCSVCTRHGSIWVTVTW